MRPRTKPVTPPTARFQERWAFTRLAPGASATIEPHEFTSAPALERALRRWTDHTKHEFDVQYIDKGTHWCATVTRHDTRKKPQPGAPTTAFLRRWAFTRLRPGESVVVPPIALKKASSLESAVRRWSKHKGLQFKVRYVDVNGQWAAEVTCVDPAEEARTAMLVVAAAPAPLNPPLLAWDFSTLQPGETRRVTEDLPKARAAARKAALRGGFVVSIRTRVGTDGAGLDVTRVRSD